MDADECSLHTSDYINFGFEENGLAASKTFSFLNQDMVEGWQTTAADGVIEVWRSGHHNVPSQEGLFFVELNAHHASNIFQWIKTIPGSTILWSVAHRGRRGVDTAEMRLGADLNSTELMTTMSDGQSWGEYDGLYTVPEGQYRTILMFEALESSGNSLSHGNFLDQVELLIAPPDCDEDGDGWPDHLDLDSDGDGCFDVLEGDMGYQAEDIDEEGRLLGAIDDDGVIAIQGRGFSQDETHRASCLPDSDGDGVPDIEEDQNENGIVDEGETDPHNPDTDGDGLWDGLELGYSPDVDPMSTTDPLKVDTDGDGLWDGEEDLNRDGNVDWNETDPSNRDTDGDGVHCDDAMEVWETGTDPLDPSSNCGEARTDEGVQDWDAATEDMLVEQQTKEDTTELNENDAPQVSPSGCTTLSAQDVFGSWMITLLGLALSRRRSHSPSST